MQTVFFNANNATVQVTVNNTLVGAAATVDALVELLLRANVSSTDTLVHSSSIDFAEEEGFDTDACAHNLIDAALADAGLA